MIQLIKIGGGAAAIAVLTFAASGALAQSSFDRSRSVAVTERPREGYEAVGARVGSFKVFPRLVLSAVYDDNLYATNTNTQADWAFQLRPSVEIQSDWSRHSLSVFGRGRIARFQDRSSENFEDITVGGAASLDINRSAVLRANGSYAALTEARTAETTPTSSAKPIEYRYGLAAVNGSYELNRLRFRGQAQYAKYDYRNGVDGSGRVISQQYRDRKTLSGLARADYAISPDTAIYVAAVVNRREYRLHPPATALDRDSDGYDVSGGVNFDFTNLVRGELQAGYLEQNYATGAVSGGSFNGRLEWFVTQLTTVTFTAARSVEESSVPTSRRGYLSTNGSVRVDHELRRNVILSAYANGSNDDYSVQDRTDRRITAGLEGSYLLNRVVGVNVAYQHIDLDSSGVDRRAPFKDNKLTLSLTSQF